MVRNTPAQLYGRETWLVPERPFDCSQPPSDGRLIPVPAHRPHSLPLSVEESLRVCARVPVKEFALFAILDDGREGTFTSGNLTSFQPKIFSPHFKSDFQKCVRKSTLEASFSNTAVYNPNSGYSDLAFDPNGRKISSNGNISAGKRRRHRPRYQNSPNTDEESSDTKKTKRNHRQYDSSEDPSAVISAKKTQLLRIGDREEVNALYHLRFKDLQQYACKVLAKVFVKLVEPRKQTHYPYTKGSEKAPPWWPPTTGDFHVRHREPDHQLKPERVRLLVHTLCMVSDTYEKQPAAVQKIGLNIKKLEEVTWESMSNWFNDKEHPKNAAKRPFLREIFKVARADERYKNGELSDDYYVTVMDKNKNGIELDDEEDDDDQDDRRKDDDDDDMQPKVESPTVLTPNSSISPTMMQPQQAGQHSEHENVYAAQSNAARFPQPTKHASSYMTEPTYAPRLNFDQSSSLHVDPSQRSMSVSGMSYQSPTQAGSFNWQGSFGNTTNSSPTSPYYTTSPQTQCFGPQAYQLPPPNSQSTVLPSHSHSMPSSYDGLPQRPQYDPVLSIGNQLRTGSLGHPHHLSAHHGGYGDMFPDANNYHNEPHLKEDPSMHQG